MRKVQVFTVRDAAAGAFAQPMFFPTVAMAARTFTDEVNRPDESNNLYRHPGDYELYHVAQWDEEAGAFSAPDEGVRCVVRAQDVAVREQK